MVVKRRPDKKDAQGLLRCPKDAQVFIETHKDALKERFFEDIRFKHICGNELCVKNSKDTIVLDNFL